MDILNNRKLILASNSPRRSELLNLAKIPFEKRIKEVEENYPSTLSIKQIPEYLAKLKADPFRDHLNDNEILLTSDTIVSIDKTVLGKPKDREQAIGFLSKLSNNTHEVLTAFNLLSNNKEECFTDIAKVKFHTLSKNEIEWYVDQYKPFDKAGAYGIQDWIGYVKIKKIKGSYATIMGLPISMVYEKLKKF